MFALETSHDRCAICLVARKRRSLNHTLCNALALVISESRLSHYLRYDVSSSPASTLTSSSDSHLCLQVCDTCVIGLSSALLSAPLVIATKGFSLQTVLLSLVTHRQTDRIHVDPRARAREKLCRAFNARISCQLLRWNMKKISVSRIMCRCALH